MKYKILIPALIVIGVAAVVSFNIISKSGRTSEEKRKLVVEVVMKTIYSGHFAPKPLDDTFSARVFDKMLHDFDYDKLFLTRQDMNMLNRYKFQIDDEIKENSIEFFDSLDAVLQRRIADAEAFYPELLSKPFSFTGNDVLQLNADKEDYTDGGEALKAKWKEYFKYRVLARYVDLVNERQKKKENKDSANVVLKTDGQLEAEARESIKKNYEHLFLRYHKWKDDERFTAYINAITLNEDPHTEYFPPAEKSEFDANMSGSFVGIGARLSPANDKITVTDLVPGSPAQHQGELKAGDEIVEVAQGDAAPVDVEGYLLNDVVNLIRGPKGTTVKLTVKRMDGTKKVIPIVRDVILMDETFAKSAIIQSKDGPIGYISLPEFYADFSHTSNRSCAGDVAIEVNKLKNAGVTGIILDLRNNGGGSLNDVVEMAGLFVGRGPVVQVKNNRSANPRVLKSAPADGVAFTGPLAIMVNEGSASASEIMAAAMQDYKRAVIVGSNTYGKGTVQQMVDLDQMLNPVARLNFDQDSEGAQGKSLGVVKLTMEKFYRVNGGSTQLKGVTPDVQIPDALDVYDDEDLGERHNKSALKWDVIPAASYDATNSVGNLPQLVALSKARIAANPIFKQVEENSEYYKRKRDDNVVSLNEKEYRKEQDSVTAQSKKLEDLQKQAELLQVVSPAQDMDKLLGQISDTHDSTNFQKNLEWLKSHSKDVYIAETVNILNDMKKSGAHVHMDKETR